jgi:pyrimidine deaminase RibD-like protein
MLIRTPLPHGNYPQLTLAPVTNYTDFLNYFRGGHTIDDNLDSRQTQESVQYNFLTTALTSGHLVKQGNPLRALQQGYFLVDIFLTEKGAASIPREDQERQFCQIAVELAKKSIPEDGEPHPFVGAVIVKDGIVIATGFRGESGKGGDHGEFCAIKKLSPENPDKVDLTGCTVYTTLEPCSIRKPGKTPCAVRLINAKAARVVYALGDKDETVFGHIQLQEARIPVGTFPQDLIDELQVMNKRWADTRRQVEVAPPPNGDTPPLATVSYNKPGTPMTDNIHLFVRPPRNADGFYTIEDMSKNVLAWGKTVDEIAHEWIKLQTQKVIVEKLKSQGGLVGGDQRLKLIY